MNYFGRRKITLRTKHHPVKYVHKVFRLLRADDQQPLIDQKIRNTSNATLPNLPLLGKNDFPGAIVLQGR